MALLTEMINLERLINNLFDNMFTHWLLDDL